MRFVISVGLIALLSFAACLYLPWWCIAIAAFVVNLFLPLRPGYAFLAGFVSLFLLWGGLALWISSMNDHLLANKMSLVILKNTSGFLLILVTALVGAVVAGFAALCGSLITYKTQNVR